MKSPMERRARKRTIPLSWRRRFQAHAAIPHDFAVQRMSWSCLWGVLTVCLAVASAHAAESGCRVIPRPSKVQAGEGAFELQAQTTVVVGSPELDAVGRYVVERLAPATGFALPVKGSDAPSSSRIVLKLDASQAALGDEGYRLVCSPREVTITGLRPAGVFYGVQTLRQLLPVEIESPRKVEGVAWSVPCVTIEDRPRFAWRGLLLDPARHFLPKGFLLKYIDVMALHKLNRLHLHLTDHEGWRLEIKRYPQLTAVGARLPNFSKKTGEGWFYSQQDIREIVAYAAVRGVVVVPEIEMPGHIGAFQRAFPETHCTPSFHGEVCIGNEKSFEILEGVLTEVAELFPSPYIHIGGDECQKKGWRKCTRCQARIQQEGLHGEAELQSYFIRRIEKVLNAKGKTLVGWDEILEGGLAPNAVVQSWRGIKGGIQAARAKHPVIMSPTSHCYFDYYQGSPKSEPKAIGGKLPLEMVYQYEPVPSELTPEESKCILGVQGNIWGEFVPCGEHAEYMSYPRGAALAEVAWSDRAGRDLNDFLTRLTSFCKRMDLLGVHYRKLDGKPFAPVEKKASAVGGQHGSAVASATALVRRLLPQHVGKFAFERIEADAGRDVFEIESTAGRVVIRGNSGVSMAMGLNWYLKYYARCHVSWYGDQLSLPNPLPPVQSKLRRTCWAQQRYFLNYCCFGYSLPWWDWPQWERLIDWMALNGVNMPLSVTGQEAVWQAVCRRLGMSDPETTEFLAGAPYLPFQWMGCLDGFGGPLPRDWIARHEALEQKILARQRELGMTPVLQGFTGHVPGAVANLYPKASLQKIRWIEWDTYLLDPLDPLFAKIAAWFLEEQSRRFGTDHLYAADTFIEMKPPSGDPKYLANLGQAIYQGMAKNDPQAVWVLQGWAFMNQKAFWTQPRVRALLDAIPNERMLILDLFCESTPMWDKTEAFCGKPWLWCNVQNFGRRVCLGAALPRNNEGIHAARRDPKAGRLVGLGFVNEGLCYNPVAYDLMFEAAWRDEPVDLPSWIDGYAQHRYGRTNADAQRVWRVLLDTVLRRASSEGSVIDQAPTLQKPHAAVADNAKLAEAWRGLVDASDELGSVDPFRFDLVNTARQVLANHAAVVQAELVKAFQAKDVVRFEAASQRFLRLIDDLDELLATRQEFLLGPWLEDAKRWGADDAERSRCEWNARRVISFWGDKSGINDYACKQWSGMLRGYYAQRWKTALDAHLTALRQGRPVDLKQLGQELRAQAFGWSDTRESYPTRPQGDSVAVARRLWQQYGGEFLQGAAALRLTPFPKEVHLDKGAWKPGPSLVLESPADRIELLAGLLGEEFRRAQIAVPQTRASNQPRHVLRLGAAGAAAVAVPRLREQGTEEDYVLCVAPGGVTIEGRGPAGLLHGVQTLVQLVRANRQDGAVPCLTIRDWPSLRWRCSQNDMTRGPSAKLETLRRQIALGAMLKMNLFTYYMEYQYAFQKHPLIGPKDGSLTAEELKALVDYGKPRGVEILGNQQSFGHFGAILSHPEYAAYRETGDILSPVNEASYRLLDDLYSEVAPVLPFPYFNVCCDETQGLGTGPSKELAAKIGAGGVYARHLRRVHDLLKDKYGKRMMMWGDIILQHPDHLEEIPKDTILLTWAYDPRKCFDNQITPFVKAGYEFFVCPGVDDWSRILPDLGNSEINIRNFVRDGAKQGALGMINTEWKDDGESLDAPNLYGNAWGAECAWNASTTDPAHFRHRLGAVLFGEKGDHFGQAIALLAQTHRVPGAMGMHNKRFWENDFLMKRSPAAVRAEAQAILALVLPAVEQLEACRREATVNADLLDALLLGARRMERIARRGLDALETARLYRAAYDGSPKDAPAMLEKIEELVRRNRDAHTELGRQFVALRQVESKPFALDRVTHRYAALDAWFEKLLTRLADIRQKAEAGQALPAPEEVGLCEGPQRRRTRPHAVRPQPLEPGLGWEAPSATHRLGLLIGAGSVARKEQPVEVDVALPAELASRPVRAFCSVANGSTREILAQIDRPTTVSKSRLTLVVPGPIPKAGQAKVRVYLGLTQPPAPLPEAASTRDGDRGMKWLENDRLRLLLGPEGGHLYRWEVKSLACRDLTMPGQTGWTGFSDVREHRSTSHTLTCLAQGPALVRYRCNEEGGLAKTVSLFGGVSWAEVTTEEPVTTYWDFDNPENFASDGPTPGEYLFSNGVTGKVGAKTQGSSAQAHGRGVSWAIKFNAQQLALGLAVPEANVTGVVGPGGGMGGVGVEYSTPVSHFVTFGGTLAAEPRAVMEGLCHALDVRNPPVVTLYALEPRGAASP